MGLFTKEAYLYSDTKENVCMAPRAKTRVTQDKPRNEKERQKLGRAMKDSPESHKTWSCQHLIYFELLAYKNYF